MVVPSMNTLDRFFAWLREELPFWILFIILIIIVRIVTINLGYDKQIPFLDSIVETSIAIFKDIAMFLQETFGVDLPGADL